MSVNYFSHIYECKTERFYLPFIDENAPHPYTHKHIWECFNTIASLDQSRITRNCRIYRQGNQLNVFKAKAIVEQICEFPSLGDVDWDMVFSGEEFLFFINHAGFYSADMLEKSKQFVGDFTDRFEPGSVSIEHHIILGSYRETPFGVHFDDPTDRVFHFNLGPSKKRLALWPREEFLRRYRNDLARPIDRVSLEGVSTFEIRPGSAFFLPADYYHVGASDEGISMVVALAFSFLSESLMLNEALAELQELVPQSFSPLRYFVNFTGERKPPRDILAPYDDIGLVTASQHAHARRKSNGSFTEILPLNFEPIRKLVGRYTMRECGIPIEVNENGTTFIYAAGHRAILETPVLVVDLPIFCANGHSPFHLWLETNHRTLCRLPR